MTDLICGMGEIGSPLLKLLKQRNFKVVGYDIDESKRVNYTGLQPAYEAIHICFPCVNGKQDEFIKQCQLYRKFTNTLIIHSTVNVGTSIQLDAIYSPIRGVHHDMFDCLKDFTKFYSWNEDNIEFQKRFPRCQRVDNPSKLERTKLVHTAKQGAHMALDRYFMKNHPYYPEYFYELHDRYGIFPTYYNDNKPFGGHCIRPNADLLGDKFIKNLIETQGVGNIENLG